MNVRKSSSAASPIRKPSRASIHPVSSGDLLYAKMPHARLAVAPTTTYWQENPDALTHVVASFVKGATIATGLPEKILHEH